MTSPGSASGQSTRTVRLDPVEVDPRAGLPVGTALLRVTRDRADGEEVFALSGSCCCHQLAYTAPRRHGRPGKLRLGDLISMEAGGESPANTLVRMRNWSNTKEELIRWIGALRCTHADDLRLVVWDDTDFEIPWELLWIPAVPETAAGEGWLGSTVTMTRWTTIRSVYPVGNGLSASGQCVGGVLAYVGNAQMSGDLDVLKQFGPQVPASLRDLLLVLEQPGARVALVYVACHGEHGSSGFRFKLDGVSLGEIGARSFQRIAESGALVFINACHSARLIDDPEYNDDTLRGFAEAFLRSGASGFVGTSGAVGEDSAREIVRGLLERLHREPDVPVAVALRDYRRGKSVAYVPPADDTAEARRLLSFFHTFMYVYFGNPSTTLQLVNSGGATP